MVGVTDELKRTKARKNTTGKYERGTRSYTMSRIRGKDTSIEVLVRGYLFRRGLRFRKNDKRYPGHPDVVLPKHRTIVFVNGCFWHMHEGCGRRSTPKSNVEFWTAKLMRNRERDRMQRALLEADGWKVITVWECELRKPVREERLARLYHQIVDGDKDKEDLMTDERTAQEQANAGGRTDKVLHTDGSARVEMTTAKERAGDGHTAADVEIRSYDRLPDEARDIRERVFVVERDYRPEFDEWDARSTHLLAFAGGEAVGTCRFYQDADRPGSGTGDGSGMEGEAEIAEAGTADAEVAEAYAGDWYVVARLAVMPQWQGRHIGAGLLREAERRIAERGGRVVAVHVEDKNYPFYERFGYTLTGDVYAGGTHGWMVKTLTGADGYEAEG